VGRYPPERIGTTALYSLAPKRITTCQHSRYATPTCHSEPSPPPGGRSEQSPCARSPWLRATLLNRTQAKEKLGRSPFRTPGRGGSPCPPIRPAGRGGSPCPPIRPAGRGGSPCPPTYVVPRHRVRAGTGTCPYPRFPPWCPKRATPERSFDFGRPEAAYDHNDDSLELALGKANASGGPPTPGRTLRRTASSAAPKECRDTRTSAAHGGPAGHLVDAARHPHRRPLARAQPRPSMPPNSPRRRNSLGLNSCSGLGRTRPKRKTRA